MKTLVSIFLLAVIFSCNDPRIDNNPASDNITEYIMNEAFKADEGVEILTLDVLEITNVEGHSLDRDYVLQLMDASDYHHELAEVEMDKIKTYTEMLNSANTYTMQEKVIEARIVAEKHFKEASRLIDEAVGVNKRIDSVKVDSMKVAKVFLKAKYQGGDRNNVLDTMYYPLDANFKVIPRRMVE